MFANSVKTIAGLEIGFSYENSRAMVVKGAKDWKRAEFSLEYKALDSDAKGEIKNAVNEFAEKLRAEVRAKLSTMPTIDGLSGQARTAKVLFELGYCSKEWAEKTCGQILMAVSIAESREERIAFDNN